MIQKYGLKKGVKHFVTTGRITQDLFREDVAKNTPHPFTVHYVPSWTDDRTGGKGVVVEIDNFVSSWAKTNEVRYLRSFHPRLGEGFRSSKGSFIENLAQTDVLICDKGSAMIQFLETGKPIVICEFKNTGKLPEEWWVAIREVSYYAKDLDCLTIHLEDAKRVRNISRRRKCLAKWLWLGGDNAIDKTLTLLNTLTENDLC